MKIPVLNGTGHRPQIGSAEAAIHINDKEEGAWQTNG
jgi:hypothetical protein